MGGGPITQILKQRAKEAEVVMSLSAAATLHHNPETVGSWGIKVIEDENAETLSEDKKYSSLVKFLIWGQVQESKQRRL